MEYSLAIALVAGMVFGLGLMFVLHLQKSKLLQQELEHLNVQKMSLDEQLDSLDEKVQHLQEENLGLQTMLSGIEAQRDIYKKSASDLENCKRSIKNPAWKSRSFKRVWKKKKKRIRKNFHYSTSHKNR